MTTPAFAHDVAEAPQSVDRRRPRNTRLVDWWSLTHVAWGISLTILAGPTLAFLLLLAWEPFEVLVLSPIAGRLGFDFGHEHWRNSLADIVFNGVGVGAGWLLAGYVWDPLGVP